MLDFECSRPHSCLQRDAVETVRFPFPPFRLGGVSGETEQTVESSARMLPRSLVNNVWSESLPADDQEDGAQIWFPSRESGNPWAQSGGSTVAEKRSKTGRRDNLSNLRRNCTCWLISRISDEIIGLSNS